MKKTCYQILAVPPDASCAEIRRAFRRRARCCHPDTAAPGMADEELFQEILAAYRLLGSPAKRALYDARLAGFRTAANSSLLQGMRKFCSARWHELKTFLGHCASDCGCPPAATRYRRVPLKDELREHYRGPSFDQILTARQQDETFSYVICEDGIIRPKSAVNEGGWAQPLRPRCLNPAVASRGWLRVLLMLLVGAWEVFRRQANG